MDPYQSADKELSFKEYVLKARSYWSEVWRYWYIPALFALLVAAYQVFKYYREIPEYPASITFIIDEDESGSSALSGMLGQIGLGGVRPNRYNFDKIMALAKSRRVVQESLLSKITIDGKQDYLANHLMNIYEWEMPSEDGSDEKITFRFNHDSIPVFHILENEMLLSLYNFVIGPPEKPEDALLTADYNEDSNIMTLSATTIHETLSIELARKVFSALSNYYVTKAIEKAKKTLEIVTTKRDSVLGVLRSAEYQLANFKDRNRGLLMRTDEITAIRLHRDVTALSVMYGEVLKNTEAADFNLRNKTPFIQVIDSPIPPIAPSQSSLIRKILIGLAIGGFIGALLVALRKAWREMMSSERV